MIVCVRCLQNVAEPKSNVCQECIKDLAAEAIMRIKAINEEMSKKENSEKWRKENVLQ